MSQTKILHKIQPDLFYGFYDYYGKVIVQIIFPDKCQIHAEKMMCNSTGSCMSALINYD